LTKSTVYFLLGSGMLLFKIGN